MENPHYQSRCRPIDSPDKYCQLETAIRPYLTKFSRDPFIPPLAPFKHQKALRHISLLSLQTIYTGLINQDPFQSGKGERRMARGVPDLQQLVDIT